MIQMVESSEEGEVSPIFWGKNMPGMQAEEELSPSMKLQAQLVWNMARKDAIKSAKYLMDLGAHKQIVNRILEPFQLVKVVLTGTDWENFLVQRDHTAAQPEIQMLANRIRNALEMSTPMPVGNGEWHVPYVDRYRKNDFSELQYLIDGNVVDLDTALMTSVACCAQVSYRKLKTDLETTTRIYHKLADASPKHMSPFEHQATPMPRYLYDKIQNGLKRIFDSERDQECFNSPLYSGPLYTYVQYRRTIKDHYRKG
jgi:hypothetical protein